MSKQTSNYFDIVFENEDFAVLNKKRGVPTAPLKTGDFSVLTEFLASRNSIETVVGKKRVEAGLLHRLDTATSGLVLVAKRQNIYDLLQHMQGLNLIEKEYIAFCDFLPLNSTNNMPNCRARSFDVVSYFVPFGKGGKKVKAILNANSYIPNKKHKMQIKKEYTTHITISNYTTNEITCTCKLTQGYRHQVRCHLSYTGLPIKGDALYNAKYIEEHKETIAEEVESHSYPLELYACKITFPSPYLPLSNNTERLSFSLPPQDRMSL